MSMSLFFFGFCFLVLRDGREEKKLFFSREYTVTHRQTWTVSIEVIDFLHHLMDRCITGIVYMDP